MLLHNLQAGGHMQYKWVLSLESWQKGASRTAVVKTSRTVHIPQAPSPGGGQRPSVPSRDDHSLVSSLNPVAAGLWLSLGECGATAARSGASPTGQLPGEQTGTAPRPSLAQHLLPQRPVGATRPSSSESPPVRIWTFCGRAPIARD